MKQTLNGAFAFGPGETITRLLRGLRVAEVAHSLSILTRELRPQEPAGAVRRPVPDGLIVREISSEKLAGYRQGEGLPSSDFFQKEFSRGARLFGAVRGEDLLAVNWVNHQWGDLTHIRRPSVTFSQGTAYLCGAEVALEHRGQGIGSLLKQELFALLRKEGYERVAVAAYLLDPRVHRWHRMNGFSLWGNISYFRWRGRDFWWTRLTPLGRRMPGLLSFS